MSFDSQLENRSPLGNKVQPFIDDALSPINRKPKQLNKSLETDKSTEMSKSIEQGLVLRVESHYLHMGKDELKRQGINGLRLKLALALLHKIHDFVYLAVTFVFAVTTLLYLLFEDFYAHSKEESEGALNLSYQMAKRLSYFVEVLRWTEFVCLSFYLLDGSCHIISYGWIFVKQWPSVVELIATLAAVIILVYNTLKETDLKPHGVVRVLIIGIIFRKLSELHLRRNPKRQLSRLKAKKRFVVQTPLETVMTTLNALIERIPKDDEALAEIKNVIEIITKGHLYDAVDVEDVYQNQNMKEATEPNSAISKWYAQYKMKSAP